ncbi:hypothetical protein ANCCEY_09965 [Ancylostoma ceylanicum]|uniref:Uncharacterized protein n=1 Tax=Ancylostoma ceylanicum TaxID=53326 RepID=A0A0D6LG59_9BILA|nr:hypothetical protein ANCCEY_09965 [Ancylostoma ceylanicum]
MHCVELPRTRDYAKVGGAYSRDSVGSHFLPAIASQLPELSFGTVAYTKVANVLQVQITDGEPDPRVKGQFEEWKECLQRNITLYQMDAKGLWANLWKGVKLCEKLPFMNDLKIENFNNGDETKRHIPSLQKDPSVIVTLGIGHDTAAEEALLKVLPAGSKFYGADPMHEVNEMLYTKFGYYFPFAVGGSSKVSTASVLINKGAEYEMFPYFYRGGKLDQSGLTLCQFNMEVHYPDDAKKKMFHAFIFEILRGNRYAFFRPVQGAHMRLYFLNFSDKHCVSKYIFRKTK